MDETILRHANRIIRASRPAYLTNEICSQHYAAFSLEIAFLSKRCCNDAKGSCIMCDYGYSNVTYSDDEYIKEMKRIINEYERIDSILLCTNGSILDENQISNELFTKILNIVRESKIEELQIETHYLNIDNTKLDLIKSICGNKTITIELGFETANEIYQNKLIMKNIDIYRFEKTLFLIQSYGFSSILNIMLGLPFLSVKEQILDTFKTIQWAFAHNCRAVVFPINIKPYTLLSHMKKTGFYQNISYWAIIYLLKMFRCEDLSKITIAWYGDREEGDPFTDEKAIFPASCDVCHPKLMKFFEQFNVNKDCIVRNALLDEIISESKKCNCYCQFMQQYNLENKICFESQYTKYISILKHDFNI